MGYTVAVTGKGGTGKTTVAAFLVKLLLEKGLRPVLAVDADPNSTLGPLLGLETELTISSIREKMMQEKYKVTGRPKERTLGLEFAECVVEAEGFDLLTMGRPEGKSCYCYVNNLLRSALSTLKANYAVTVVDNEAGMEHLSRMNVDSVDTLVIVSEATVVSARSAARVSALAGELEVQVGRRVLVWNKVPPGGVPRAAADKLAGERFDATVVLPVDEQVGRLAAAEESVLSAETPPAFAELLEACVVDASPAPSG